MATQTEGGTHVRRYPVEHAASEYTFPSDSRVESVSVDNDFIHVELRDGRRLSVPLAWIPPVRDATPEARNAFVVNDAGTAIVWDPDTSGINDDLCIADFLVAATPASG